MSLLLKSMWRSVLHSNPVGRTVTLRSLCSSLSELPRSKPVDPVMSSLKAAGRADDVLSCIAAHLPEMSPRHLVQALRTLFELQRAGKQGDNTALIQNPTFGLLCKNVKKYARELEVNEAIDATKALSYLKVPADSLIVQTMLQIIRCNINQLSIRHIMFLDFLLGRFDKNNHLVDALKLALPLAFQIHLPMEIDHEDLPLLKDMLAYACSRGLPDRIVNNVVTGLLLHDQAIDAQTAKSVIWSLCQVNCTESNFPTRVQLLHVCFDILCVKMDMLTYDEVLKTAAKLKGRILEKHPEYYHEQMMDGIANYVVHNDIDFERGLLVSRVLSRIAHTHLGLMEHLCRQAVASPTALANARTNILFGFINCLSNNDYMPNLEQWTEIKRQLTLNPILDSKNFALPWTKLCLEMASLGHFDDRVLSRVFSNDFLHSYLARDDNVLDYLQMFTLHEAVKAFHCKDYSLPEDVLEKAKAMYPINKLSEQIQQYVAKGLGGDEFVVRNVLLPSGFNADLLICLKGRYPVELKVPSSNVKVPLEELNLPQGTNILCLITFNAGCFSINSNRLRGTFRLILDILDQQGYLTVPINTNEWMNTRGHERTPYLMREIGYKCGEIGIKLAGT